MGKNANIIELNGKRYDALTGAMLSGAAPTPGAGRQFVDGFVRPNSVRLSPATTLKPAAAPASPRPASPKKAVMDIKRPAGIKVAHHAPTKSQTLMRSAVHKPEPSLRRKSKPVTHTHALVEQPKFEVVKKLSHPKIDPKRVQRSSMTKQSEFITRFAKHQAAPRPSAARAPADRPGINPAQLKPVHASTPAAHAVASPQASSLDVFERALQRANSHMELPTAHNKRRDARHKSRLGKRAFNISVASLAVLLITGFVAYQNQANLTVKYASSKAGFSAALPGYKPTGFSAGKFSYSPGQVAVVYHNAASGQSFNLVQKQSPWDSASLRDDFVAAHNDSYKTVEAAGRTIYTYGQNNATWVNGGVWYQVTTAGSLTTQELVSLATSM